MTGSVRQARELITWLRGVCDAVEAREGAATGDRWMVEPAAPRRVRVAGSQGVAVTVAFEAADADVIVLSRNALPATVAAVRRVLADLEQVVERAANAQVHPRVFSVTGRTLMHLATIFSDWPGYQDAWRQPAPVPLAQAGPAPIV